MKTFKDLIFKVETSSFGFSINRAVLDLDNGWGISVINGGHTYSDEDTYEVGIRYNGKLHYDNEIAQGDVISYQLPEEIDNILKQLETK